MKKSNIIDGMSEVVPIKKSAHCAADGAVGVTSRERVRGAQLDAAWQALID
jgi:hypothetical protein